MNTQTLENTELQKYIKFPESETKIRFQDCDPFGHLNNARYLDYFMHERTEQVLKHYGLDLNAAAKSGRSWVVRNSMVSHQLPARFGETVIIKTSVLNFSKTSITVEGVMTDVTKSNVHAGAWAEFVYIDINKGRPVRHEDDLMDLFSQISLDQEFSFGDLKKRTQIFKKGLQNTDAIESAD